MTDSTDGPTPVSALTRRLGFPVHALLVMVPVGLTVAALCFDVASRLSTAPCTDFAYPTFLLTVAALASAIVAAVPGVVDLRRRERGTPGHTTAMWHSVVSDLALVPLVFSAALRHDSEFCAAPGVLTTLLSAAAAALMVASAVLGLRVSARFSGWTAPSDAPD